MPEFHSVGHGRYAPLVPLSSVCPSSCAILTATLARAKKKATMTVSSSTGERSLSHTYTDSLHVRSWFWALHPHPALTLPTLLLKSGPQFPRADGRQNGYGFRRRVFLWWCVRAARFHFFACELVDVNGNRTV
jgi:hypothetical protein